MQEHERSQNVPINPQPSLPPRAKVPFHEVERVAEQQAARLIKNFGMAPQKREEIIAALLDVLLTRFVLTFEGVQDGEDESELDDSDVSCRS